MKTSSSALIKPFCIIVFLLVVCSATAAGIDLWRDRVQEEEVAGESFELVQEELRPLLESGLNDSFTETDVVLQHCVWKSGITYVIITDRFGSLLSHSFSSILPPEIVRQLPYMASRSLEEGQELETVVTWPVGKKTLHNVRVLPGYSAYLLHVGVADPIQDVSFFALWLEYGGLFAFALILFFVLAALVYPPLRRHIRILFSSQGTSDYSGAFSGIAAPGEAGVPFWRGERGEDTPISFDPLSAGALDTIRSLSLSVASMTEGFLLLDESGRIVMCNDAIAHIFGMHGSPLGLFFPDVFGSDDTQDAGSPRAYYSEKFYYYVINVGAQLSTEITIENSSGKENYYVLIIAFTINNNKFTFCCIKNVADFCSMDAVTRQMQGELDKTLHDSNRDLMRLNAQLRIENAERSAVAQALRRAESRYRDIFDNATEGIFQWTPEWRLLSANMSFAKMLGYNTVNALLLSAADTSFHFCLTPAVEKELVAELEINGNINKFELQVVRQDGSSLWASMNARRVAGPGGYTSYYEAFIENITSRKSTEEKLVYQAFHDPLTGLANRALFYDRLRMAIRRSSRQPGNSFAVLYLDLDRFKIVNDSFGHNTGDAVLCHAAMSILSCVRTMDTVARFGGDEFAVLIDDAERASLAIRVAKRIHTALSQPFAIEGQEISIGASIGIVLRAEQYELPEDILRDADTAMYRAKAAHNTSFKVFSQRMREETIESISFENDFRLGVKNEEFFMEYQPVVHITTGELYGFEALIRWRRKGQVVGPSEFIPVAEETGLIKQLGLYLLERVCHRIVRWSTEFKKPFVMHLNISGRQLVFPSFPREVQKIIERTGVDPSYLRFEITESVLLDNGGACIMGIQQIRDLGIQFCLDDFGTGFSSLSYLRQLPLDCIKVDRSFVVDLEIDTHSIAIVRNLVCLGHDLGLSVVVEGIERASQVETLVGAGCSLAQGYFFHRPLSAEQAEELLL